MDFTYWDYIKGNGYPHQRRAYLNRRSLPLAVIIYASTAALWFITITTALGVMFTLATVPFLLLSCGITESLWVMVYYPILGLIATIHHVWSIRH